jgi:UDP-N-acetyl-D-mannosaminuronic acid dehydrogenase
MSINNLEKGVCVIGLGRIGLPLACILASYGYTVNGVDIDNNVLSLVRSGTLFDPEPHLQNLLKSALKSGNLKVSTDVSPTDIYIIAVPTPLGLGNKPDVSHVYCAVESIRPHLRSQDLVLIESTCPIGTTEAIAGILQNSCPGVHVAYCPERVLPGNILHELIHNDRIVGGVNESSISRAIAFYKSFVSGDVLPTCAKTAEAVKLAENAYRDINIAYANELSMIADRLDININELIQLANRHPRVQILNPGPGVGGHCIAIDPWFLVSSASDLTLLCAKAREVNVNKTNWVIQKIRATIKKHSASVIVCLGTTYKPDVSDTRESPSLVIMQALEMDVEVLRYDPYIATSDNLHEVLKRAEIVVGLVAHSSFLNIPSSYLSNKIVLDFAGVFK